MDINRKKRLLTILCTVILLFTASTAWSLTVPAWTGPVNDQANILSVSEKQTLTAYLTDVNDQTGVQAAVLIVRSLDGEALESYSMRVAEAWKLGQKGKDNGALLLVAMNEHKIRIETGYGLEGKLTDVKAGLIIRNVITPYFKSGKYGEGIEAGIQNIIGVATDNADITAESVANPQKKKDNSDAIAAILFFIIFFGIITSGIGQSTGHLGWLPWLWLFGSATRGTHTYTGHDDFHSNFGGFGGGGFSGGGGGFGGGGASGSW
ncbi:MAG: TPM domain-containing protein [Treponema sp.]|jgi:uncharacterized protein|nr:TPM domain-containing protein [Treponema sp.]